MNTFERIMRALALAGSIAISGPTVYAQQPAQQTIVAPTYEDALELKDQGEYEKVMEIADDALGLTTYDPGIIHVAAWSAVQLGELDRAEEYLDAFLRDVGEYDEYQEMNQQLLRKIQTGEIRTQEEMGEPVAVTPFDSVVFRENPASVPVPIYHQELPDGVDESEVNVLDPEDLYCMVSGIRPTDIRGDCGISKGLTGSYPDNGAWLQGDIMDVLEYVYSDYDIMTIGEFEDETLSNNRYLIINERITESQEIRVTNPDPYNMEFDAELIESSDVGVHIDLSSDKIGLVGGGSLDIPNSYGPNNDSPVLHGFLALTHTSPKNKHTEGYELLDVLEFRMIDASRLPNGKYQYRFTSNGVPNYVDFEIQHDQRPDPDVALKLGTDYLFEDEPMSWDIFKNGEEPLEVRGNIYFDLETIYFHETEEPIDVHLIPQSVITDPSYNPSDYDLDSVNCTGMYELNTSLFEDGSYELRIGSFRRMIHIQNNASHVKELSGNLILEPRPGEPYSFYENRLPPALTDSSFFTLYDGRRGSFLDSPRTVDKIEVYLDGELVHQDEEAFFGFSITTDPDKREDSNVYVPLGEHELEIIGSSVNDSFAEQNKRFSFEVVSE